MAWMQFRFPVPALASRTGFFDVPPDEEIPSHSPETEECSTTAPGEELATVMNIPSEEILAPGPETWMSLIKKALSVALDAMLTPLPLVDVTWIDQQLIT